MIWHVMIWYMIWYDTIRYDAIRYDMIWYDMHHLTLAYPIYYIYAYGTAWAIVDWNTLGVIKTTETWVNIACNRSYVELNKSPASCVWEITINRQPRNRKKFGAAHTINLLSFIACQALTVGQRKKVTVVTFFRCPTVPCSWLYYITWQMI